MSLEKSMLRIQLLKRRNIMTISKQHAAEITICKRLLNWWHVNKITLLGIYLPIHREPDLRIAYSILYKYGVRFCLPKIRGKKLPLDFISWTFQDSLIQDKFGTLFSKYGKVIQPQGILVPCVGFNTARVRLGYGYGYYDRTIAQLNNDLSHKILKTIGIAYSNTQIIFTPAAHDTILDIIITN